MRGVVISAILVLAIVLSVIPGGWSCQKGPSEPVESIAVAWSPFEQGALLWIAEDQNIFGQNGLNIAFEKHDTGAGSLDGVLNGQADITIGVSEFPMVRSAFQQSSARIIGAVAKIEQQYLVARKDRGIEGVTDLRGKRVGTTIGTIAEFCLGRFLQLNGMSMQDVTRVDLRTPAEWENTVVDGVVDAMVTAQPYADLAIKRLGDNAIVWPAQGNQYIYGLVVCSEEWLTTNPDAARRFLKALVQAEEYAVRNPSEAKAIMQKKLGVGVAFVESAWLRDRFSVSLDQSLVAAMEDEARWMIANNLTTERQVPNFGNYISEAALKAVKPDAVNIIR